MDPEAVIQMTDDEFERQTLEAIRRGFGLSGLTRFLRTYRSGQGDYTRDRGHWIDGLTVDQIVNKLQPLH